MDSILLHSGELLTEKSESNGHKSLESSSISEFLTSSKGVS